MAPTAQTGPVAGTRMRLVRWRAIYVAAFVVLASIGFAMGRHGHPIAGIVAGALAVTAIAYGVAALRPPRAPAWGALGVAVALLALGETFAGLSHTFGDRFPAATDIASVADYLPLAVAALWIGHPPRPRRHVTIALDAAILSLAVALLAWVTLIRPTIAKLNLSTSGRDLIIVDWATDIATLAIAVLLFLTWRTNRSALLLGAAIIALLTSDVWQSIALLHGSSRETTIDAGFILFCALIGLAALDPAMTHVTAVGATPEQLSVWRLTALAVALLLPPSILLVKAVPALGRIGAADIAAIGAVMGLLLLARVAVGVRALRDRTIRERAMNDAADRLGAAQTSDEITEVIGSAAKSMLAADNTAVSLCSPDERLTGSVELRETLGGGGFLRIPISAVPADVNGSKQSIGEVRFSGPALPLFAHRPEMTTLANQAGVALTRIGLEATVREHQRESYFRTLVHNSSDVILICRDGIVDYATPAARDLFAEATVVGTRIENLIVPADPKPMSDVGSTEATVRGPDGPRRVPVRRQDLIDDPTVRGTVLTLHDITEQRRLHDELTYQATHDTLTGLPNRQLLRDHLRHLGHAANAGVDGAALFIDLDNLKEINDTLGHVAGDELLKIAADRILGCLRHDDVAARLGGDEFAALLRDPRSVAEARILAQRMVDAFHRPIYVRDMPVDCTVSVGLAGARTPGEYASLMRRADVAVYAAKAAGKNTWREYHADTYRDLDGRAVVRNVDDTIPVHYQPIAELVTGEIVGYEAVTRPDRGSSTPADAIGAAEHDGLVAAVGDRVLEAALEDIRILDRDADRYVSVNATQVQLRHPSFAVRTLDRLAANGVAPTRLVLELTETLLLDGRSNIWHQLALLHDSGVRIALDNFGTTSASLSQLRHRAIDVVKLDASFVQDRTDPRLPAMLDAIVDLTDRLDLELIAVGVNDAGCRDFAVGAGLRVGQGRLLGPALPPDEVAARADTHIHSTSQG